jgi:hypothetical protein
MLQEVIGQVWTGTARTGVKLGGIRSERTFDLAMLEYNSLFHLTHGTEKKLWYLLDPLEDNLGRPLGDYRRNFHQTLAAALLNPGVDSFEVMPWPQRIYGQVADEYATEVNTVVGALTEMWQYPNARIDSGSRGLATVVADSMGWQRADPSPSDIDGFYGLALPFTTNGVLVDVVSLDRMADSEPNNGTKALLLSYDFLKPRGPEVHAALARWVKRGGILLFFGGSDAYNTVPDSWWIKAGFSTPTEHLLAQLGIESRNAKVVTTAENTAPWQTLLQGESAERELKNRKQHVADLSPFVRENGSVSIRFEDVSPLDGWGPYVASAELRVNGRIAAAFRTGSELESRFLEDDKGSRYDYAARFADGPAYWTYRFDNLPKDAQVTLALDMGNGFLIKARPSRPHPVIQAGAGVPAMFGRLRIPHPYAITLAPPPAGATPLYTLGGETAPPVWEAAVDKGGVIYCGIAPGYLSANAMGARWIRWLGERALAKAGVKYDEQDFYRVVRGPYMAVRTLAKPITLNGRYVNLLDPSLPILESPVIPSQTAGFFIDAGPERGNPRTLAVSGRLRARAESANETSWLAAAPTGTEGAARIWSGDRRVLAVKASTALGQQVPVTSTASGDTLLVRYTNDADGVVVRVIWQPQ